MNLRKALNALFQQYWDENLERNPEFASTLGDKRWNDKLTDYSVKAENDWTAQQVAQYPDRLRAFCSVNPLKPYALDEVARCYGITRERIRQIEARSLLKLRQPTRSQRLAGFTEHAEKLS